MLTDDIKTAVSKLRDALALGQGDVITAVNTLIKLVNDLLAAHSAGAQGEPVAWRAPWNGDDSDLGAYHYASDLSETDASHIWEPLYTHPQPMPQTDAVRDAFLALIAKVPHKPQASTYEKGWELLDELQRIAEIERLDRAKGE